MDKANEPEKPVMGRFAMWRLYGLIALMLVHLGLIRLMARKASRGV